VKRKRSSKLEQSSQPVEAILVIGFLMAERGRKGGRDGCDASTISQEFPPASRFNGLKDDAAKLTRIEKKKK